MLFSGGLNQSALGRDLANLFAASWGYRNFMANHLADMYRTIYQDRSSEERIPKWKAMVLLTIVSAYKRIAITPPQLPVDILLRLLQSDVHIAID